MKVKRYMLFLLLNLLLNAIQSKNATHWADSIYNVLQEEKEKQVLISEPHTDTLLYIYQLHGEFCKSIDLLYISAEYYKIKSDYKKALSCAILANQIIEKDKCKSPNIKPKLYYLFAKIFLSLKDIKKAKKYIDLGIQSWQQSDLKKEILIRLYLLKGALSENSKEELYFYTLAYGLSIESKDVKMEEISLHSMGSFYAVNNQFDLALKYLKSSLKFALHRKAYSSLTSLYNNLAGLSKEPEEISMFIDSAIYFAEKSGDLEDLQTSKQNKAYHLFHTKEFEDAYNYLWESFQLKDSILNKEKIEIAAEMSEKFETEQKQNTITQLQKENEIGQLKSSNKQNIITGLLIALIMFIIISNAFYKQKQKKQKLNNELTLEQIKSDELLRNILPAEIAEELKWSGKSEAKLYNQVSVLFTDFVNFTGISQEMSPTELVQEIHANFTAFDAIMEKHGIEKIKTIGDAYLAVCGLPHENPQHAQRIVAAAIDIQAYMQKIGGKFQIRIGVHSGPVVAGIVGIKKYAYDIWGDTVNTAARMEQNSLPGNINISGTTYELIKSEFTCEYRGKIDAKNKGEVDMYFVKN